MKLEEAILMNTHNIHVYNKNKKKVLKIFLNIFELSEEFPRDSKTSSNQPPVFESLTFYCFPKTPFITMVQLEFVFD